MSFPVERTPESVPELHGDRKLIPASAELQGLTICAAAALGRKALDTCFVHPLIWGKPPVGSEAINKEQ